MSMNFRPSKPVSIFVINHECRASELNLTRQKFNGVPSPHVSLSCQQTPPRKCPHDETSRRAHFQSKCRPFARSCASESVYSSMEDFCTHAILDTGASRCIIGDKTLQRLKQSLTECVRSQIRQTESSVKFRFGNNQSLT